MNFFGLSFLLSKFLLNSYTSLSRLKRYKPNQVHHGIKKSASFKSKIKTTGMTSINSSVKEVK